MIDLKVLVLFGILCTGVTSNGNFCYKSEWNWYWSYWDTQTFYCDNGCCGDYHEQYCCTKKGDDDDEDKEGGWTAAAIVGVSLGGLIAFLFVILVIFCVVKLCQKSNSKLVTVQPAMGMNVWSTTRGGQANAPYSTHPPPNPVTAFPDPPPYQYEPGPSYGGFGPYMGSARAEK